MKLYARVSNVKSLVPLEVSDSDTVHMVKMKIQMKTKFLPENMNVSFQGTKLEDTNQICSYEILNGSVLHVSFYKSNNDADDLIDSKKSRVASSRRIFVSPPSGPAMTIEVDETDSIEDIKKKIESQNKIPGASYDLCKNLLLDSHALSHYNLGPGSVLRMTLKLRDCETIRVHVTMPDIPHNILSFDIHQSDTIHFLKAKIKEVEGLSVDRQCLLYEGVELFNNSFTVSHYKIQNNSNLTLQYL